MRAVDCVLPHTAHCFCVYSKSVIVSALSFFRRWKGLRDSFHSLYAEFH